MELINGRVVSVRLPLVCEGRTCGVPAVWRCIVSCGHGHDTVLVMCTEHRDDTLDGTATCVTHDCAVQVVVFKRLHKE